MDVRVGEHVERWSRVDVEAVFTGGGSDKSIYWKLTPAGDDYLVKLRAMRRIEEAEESNESDTVPQGVSG